MAKLEGARKSADPLPALRQPCANPLPTLRQPFLPTLCQPFLPTPLQPPLSVDPRHPSRNRAPNVHQQTCTSRWAENSKEWKFFSAGRHAPTLHVFNVGPKWVFSFAKTVRATFSTMSKMTPFSRKRCHFCFFFFCNFRWNPYFNSVSCFALFWFQKILGPKQIVCTKMRVFFSLPDTNRNTGLTVSWQTKSARARVCVCVCDTVCVCVLSRDVFTKTQDKGGSGYMPNPPKISNPTTSDSELLWFVNHCDF